MSNDDTIPRPQLGLEIATTADGRDITRPYSGALLVPHDRVLRVRGAGDLQIYEQVLSDPQVKACFEQRRNAVTSAEWQVDAASDRPIDQQAADHARLQLQRIGWDRVTDRMLYGVFYGYSAAELLWDVVDGKLGWSAIKVRNRRRFKFSPEGELRLITLARMYDGEPALAPYFWHLATGTDHDDEPYGTGLGHWLYWPTLFKRNDIAFWLTFLDKFAAPTGVGKFPSGATDAEKNRLLSALAALRSDSGVIIPEGMTIDLLEAARSGTADYKVMHDTMDDAIAKAIIGQTASSQGTPGRLGDDELQSDVRQDIVKADADLICESFNLGPLRWLTMFNFPGAEPPRVYRVIEEPEDAETVAKRDKLVMDMGYRPSLEYVKQTYGDHWEEKQPEAPAVVPGQSALPDEDVPAFAEPIGLELQREEAQNRIDMVIDAAHAFGLDWRTFVEPRVQELQKLLDQVDDLEQFRERVIELAEAPPNSDLAEALARCGFAARLLGRIPKEK